MAQLSREKVMEMRTHVMELGRVGTSGQWLQSAAARPNAVVGTSALVLAGAAALVWVSPWLLGFAVAVGAAMFWCAWLDRHPE